MPKPPAPSRLAEQFVVRLPDGMRDQIAEAAKAANRSMNAEIVARLAASFQDQKEGDTTELVSASMEAISTGLAPVIDKINALEYNMEAMARQFETIAAEAVANRKRLVDAIKAKPAPKK